METSKAEKLKLKLRNYFYFTFSCFLIPVSSNMSIFWFKASVSVVNRVENLSEAVSAFCYFISPHTQSVQSLLDEVFGFRHNRSSQNLKRKCLGQLDVWVEEV